MNLIQQIFSFQCLAVVLTLAPTLSTAVVESKAADEKQVSLSKTDSVLSSYQPPSFFLRGNEGRYLSSGESTPAPKPKKEHHHTEKNTDSNGGSSIGGGGSGGGVGSTGGSGGGGGGGGSSSNASDGASGGGGGGGGGAGVNGVISNDLVQAKHRNIALMLSVAAVAGVAIAALVVPRNRNVQTRPKHSLNGSINRRINLFSNLARHADSSYRPPRRGVDGNEYVNAESIV